MIVPINQQQQLREAAIRQAAAPPNPTFALMAAAQMHTEGRLIKKPLDPKTQTQAPVPTNAPSHL